MKLLLLDGNSLTYRAFYALPTDMATASGQVTNAVFGFTSMFAYLLKDQHPDGVMVAFDRPEKTFRHDANPLYKAQREAAPDILRQQMGLVREVLDALHVHVVDLAGWEADDILATVAEQAKAEGHEVIIVTGDRDSYQLVDDPGVKVLYNRRGVSDYALYDEAGIKDKTGVTPAQYTEYAALRGDPSDNLDGVPGVGEKTAAKLINAYGGLDGIFANVDAQTPKLRASLAEHEDRVRSNAELMILRRNAPIEVDLNSLTIEPDVEAARKLFDFLEFRALTDRLFEALGTPGSPQTSTEAQVLEAEITDLTDAGAAVSAITALASLDVVCSWAGEPGRSDLIGLAIVTDRDACEVAWIPAEIVADPAVLGALASHPQLRGHNAKALMRWALGHGMEITGLQLDVAIAAYLIDPADVRYALADLLQRYTSYQLPSNDASSAGQLDFSEEGDDNRRIAGRGALAVAHLSSALQAALEKQGMAELYATIENPLVGVLAEMEHVGIAVDMAELQRLNHHLTSESERLAAELQRVVGRPFNFNSPVQLRELLYTEKQLAPQKKTKTGYSTDAATLLRLRDEWPEFIDPLMQYREMEKLRGTYGTGLMAEVAPDGRIHATFNQTVARTGRLSSDQPNLHNIPVRSDEGRQFRKAFVPAPGYVLLVADYNQIELRCIAHLAADPGADRSVPQRGRHPQCHGSQGVRRRAEGRHDRDAIEGQDGQLWAGLRHGVLRARSAIGDPDGRCSRDPRCVLRRLPECEGVHGSHGDRGSHARLHRDVVRSPPSDSGAVELQLPDSPGRRAPGDERGDPGPGRRHLQGGAGSHQCRVVGVTRRQPADLAGARRGAGRGAGVGARHGRPHRDRHHAPRRRARRPPGGQRLVGFQLGQRQG